MTSDPECIITEYNSKTKEWVEVARTGIIKSILNPDWPAVQLKYWFEKRQLMRFTICDTPKQRDMGFYETTMGKLMGAKSQMLQVKLENSGKSNKEEAMLILRA